jgi:glycerol kinase
MREPHAKPFGAEGERLMRRPLTLLATVAILIGLVAAPAAADKPTEQTVTINSEDEGFEIWDPCTGEPMHDEIVWTAATHEHINNIVETAKVTGYTYTYTGVGDEIVAGYIMSPSSDTTVINSGSDVLMSVYNKRWSNPTTGDRMHTSRVIVITNFTGLDTDYWLNWDIKIWTSRSWCTSGPTVPPRTS